MMKVEHYDRKVRKGSKVFGNGAEGAREGEAEVGVGNKAAHGL